MISELPDSVQGVDALSKLTARDMDERSDVDQPRRTTGISERELAELIESGDIEAIKHAMPRMTPEMRRIAEAVINGDLGWSVKAMNPTVSNKPSINPRQSCE